MCRQRLTLRGNIEREATGATGGIVVYAASALTLWTAPWRWTVIRLDAIFPLGTTTSGCSAA